MKRRQLLSLCGAAILGGCLDSSEDSSSNGQETEEEPTPTETVSPTPTSEATPTAQPMSDSEAFGSLEETAAEMGVSIENTFIGEDRAAFFEYTDDGKSRSERETDVRELSKAYLSLIEQGWQAELLEASLIREDETIIFSWLIEPEWVEDHLNGDMTKDDVADKAIETIL